MSFRRRRANVNNSDFRLALVKYSVIFVLEMACGRISARSLSPTWYVVCTVTFGTVLLAVNLSSSHSDLEDNLL